MPQTHSSSSPWIQLDLATWSALLERQTPIFYAKNSFLFCQGDSADFVYIVKKGRLRITFFHKDGMEKQLYIAEEGCLCGENACLSGHPHTTAAMAIVDTWVYKVSTQELARTMQADWALNQSVLALLCRKNQVYLSQIISLSFSQATQRVAQHLIDLCRQYGTATPDGCRLTIKFTQSELAQLVNTSRVTVSNIFNQLTDRGAIMKKNGAFYVRDLALLENLASGLTEL